jgi:RNA polymerase sigma factor (sigma-70 family)
MRLSDWPRRASRRDVRHVNRRNRLVERHLFLVTAVARRLKRSLPPWVELDELLADGALGLLHAAIRFDRKRGVPFARFATRYIRAAMIDAVRRRRHAPLPLGDCEVASVDPHFERVDHRLDARAIVARERDARRRLVVVLYFFDQLTMKRVGRRLGVSEARVSQLVKGSLERLRATA